MNLRLFLFPVAIFGLCAALVPPLGAALRSPAVEREAAVGPRGEPDPEFKRKFQAAMKLNSKNDMAKLVKDRTADAVAWIVRTGEEIADGRTEELESFMTELKAAWATSIKSEFAERTHVYFSTLEPSKKKNRADLKKEYEKLLAAYEANLERKDGYAFKKVAEGLDIVANGFEQEGDFYYASEAWNVYGTCFDEPLRGGDADLREALKAYDSALRMRDQVDLKDKLYEDLEKRKVAMTTKGADKPAPPPPPPQEEKEPAPVAVDGAAVTVKMSFEVVEEVDAFARPHFLADDIYVLWNALGFSGKGTTATFVNIPTAPLATRVGSNDVRFDTDGDGQPDVRVPLTGNITPVKITIGKGQDQRPWAFLAQTGEERDQFQGIETNLHPNDEYLTIYTFGAASIVGVLNGIPIRICDDGMDGAYGSVPQTWAHTGLTKDNFQPEMDSIVIGNSKRARPWSEIQEIGGKWYKLAPSADGTELRATPVKPETGIVKLDFKGPAPSWVVLRGTKDFQNSFYDLVEGGAKGTVVPAGHYSLYYGEVRKGKKRETRKTLILPGKSMPGWDVKAGETITVSLGAPFGFDFKKVLDGNKMVLEGESVVIIGARGERYERAWNCRPRPEVSWRKKGGKKASKPVRMDLVIEDDVMRKMGVRAAWSPLDVEFDVRGEGTAIELQLVEKKHELFGKIESEWRE